MSEHVRGLRALATTRKELSAPSRQGGGAKCQGKETKTEAGPRVAFLRIGLMVSMRLPTECSPERPLTLAVLAVELPVAAADSKRHSQMTVAATMEMHLQVLPDAATTLMPTAVDAVLVLAIADLVVVAKD